MNIQVHHAPGPLAILSTNLDELLALSDPDAAESLNAWMAALKRVEEVYEVSYGQRLVIIRNFEERSLWRYLTDPDTDLPFPNLTAWLSSGFIGCRRTNMDAHKDALMLSDVPAVKLIDVPRETIKVLKKLSTDVRNDAGVLEAARRMGTEDFEEKIEKEHPNQCIERRQPMRFSPGRSWARTIEEAITYALEHDIAGTRDEALLRMAETSLNDWRLDEEIKSMPAEVTA